MTNRARGRKAPDSVRNDGHGGLCQPMASGLHRFLASAAARPHDLQTNWAPLVSDLIFFIGRSCGQHVSAHILSACSRGV